MLTLMALLSVFGHPPCLLALGRCLTVSGAHRPKRPKTTRSENLRFYTSGFL
jgi:hypothetical protein